MAVETTTKDTFLAAVVARPMVRRPSSRVVTEGFANGVALVARYVVVSLPMFAAWEVVQLPLYTIWDEQGVRTSLLAAAHCTAGDAVYALLTLGCALIAGAYAPALRSTAAIDGVEMQLADGRMIIVENKKVWVTYGPPDKGGTYSKND